MKGPGYKLFAAVKEELGELNIIAEDLGFMTDEVIELRETYWLPRNEDSSICLQPRRRKHR